MTGKKKIEKTENYCGVEQPGNSTETQEILSELKRLKRASPKIGYSEFWKELKQAVEKENAAFAKEDERLTMSAELLHRPFTTI